MDRYMEKTEVSINYNLPVSLYQLYIFNGIKLACLNSKILK